MIKFERQGHCAVVTLNRPEARNAINRALEQALYEALELVDADPDVYVGVIAAEGEVFCAGADLKEIGEKGSPRNAAPPRESIVSRAHKKPLIAAVEGPALGGGMELVLACDMVVASRASKFGLSEVRWGLLPSGGGLFRLPRVLPRPVALQLLLGGAPISAARAYELGLVNELAESGAVLAAALTLAQKIAANGPLAVQLCLQAVNATAHLDDAQAWPVSRRLVAQNFASTDAKEGPRAFAEKRAPQWSGR